ncbi:MAG: hypothetical protein Q8N95_06735 [Desulfobacterales bacterium]|nr:hypothetical protein [Desulfobacterales bacterium]
MINRENLRNFNDFTKRLMATDGCVGGVRGEGIRLGVGGGGQRGDNLSGIEDQVCRGSEKESG